MEICLDTDVLVALLRNDKKIVSWFNLYFDSTFYITPISIHELYLGAYKHANKDKMVSSLSQFLSQFTVLPLTNEMYALSGKELAEFEIEGRPLDLRDLLIGICARENGVCLKTNNVKHFSLVAGLKLAS
jgi:tRNA(fMet)-specific endonuclease VapC